MYVGGCGVDDGFRLGYLTVVCDFVWGAVLLGGELLCGWVVEVAPEVCAAEDYVRTLEGLLEGGDVVEVAGDDVDALGRPFLCRGLGRVAGDAADFPSRLGEEYAGDG